MDIKFYLKKDFIFLAPAIKTLFILFIFFVIFVEPEPLQADASLCSCKA